MMSGTFLKFAESMYSLQFFINFRGDAPVTLENGFIPSALAFGPSALSCPQKGPHFSPPLDESDYPFTHSTPRDRSDAI